MNITRCPITQAVVLLVAGSGACFAAVTVPNGQLPQAAPPNPVFVQYLAAVNAGQPQPGSGTAHNYGLIPLPVDLSYLQPQQQALQGPPPQTYDPVYDLRVLGRVTAVRDQNPYGTCWSFATVGSMESCLRPGETWDFSEDNLVNLAGYDWGFNSGGNAFMSMAYLARWAGPVSEADDCYPDPGGSCPGLTVKKHVQQVRLIPAKTGPTLNDELKQVLMDSGGIYVSFYYNDGYYNPAYMSYCFTGSAYGNHAVTLVGWDDNFDRYKFYYVPAGNGAYIVKNSWGAGWGENGYFYVSYYDTTFAHDAMFAFLNAEATTNYMRQYSYDPLGWVGSLGVGTITFWGANVFTATASENLNAVGFYANGINASYLIEVWTGITAGSPRSGTLASTKAGTCSYPGYRTLNLDTPAVLTAGQLFSIVLRLTTPGYNYPQCVEYASAGYSSGATASPGQSYYSSSGSSWTDLTTFDSTANFCIKGFTAIPAINLRISPGGGTVTLTWAAGVLQQADSSCGPFTDVPGVASPHTAPASGSGKFYRVRLPMP